MVVDGRTQVQEVLAANVRRLRIARHLSLSELARATSISKATLSSIENGRANPTLDTLVALAAAMRISLDELLEEPPLGEMVLVRAAARTTVDRRGITEYPIHTFASDGLSELVEIEFPPRRLHESPLRPAGSHGHVFVLRGKLVAGPTERVTELGPRDYLSFPTDVPHVFETAREPARALVLFVQAPGAS